MALRFGNFIFYHIGRTAGYWVRDNVGKLYEQTEEMGGFHCSPRDVADERKTGLTSFTLVRHPLEWLRSFWMHDVVNGTPPGYVEKILSKNFEEFLRGVLDYSRKNTAFVSEVFAPYVDNVELVYRSEDLPAPIVELLGSRDPSISLAGFDFTKRSNEGALFDLSGFAKASPDLLAEIMETERAFFSRFGYEDVPEKLIGEVSGHSRIFLPIAGPRERFASSGVPVIYPRYFEDSPLPLTGRLAVRDYHQISYALQEIGLAEKSVLDIGAADCGLSELAIAAGARNVTAFDLKISGTVRDYISSAYPEQAQLQEGSFYELSSCLHEKANLALAVNLFHNLPHSEKFILELYRSLEDQGEFFMHVPVWDDVEIRSEDPVWKGFGVGKQILEYPCVGLYNESGIVDLFKNCGFALKKKHYEYNFGPVPGYASPEIDGTRFGPVKLCGFLFRKEQLNRRVENWNGASAYFGLPKANFDLSELSDFARELLARNSRLAADAKNLMLDIGAREGVINSLRGQLFELSQRIDELRAEVLIARGDRNDG